VPFVNVTALNKAGFQWIRRMVRNPALDVVPAWVIDPANSTGLANDDNTGATALLPLLTFAELARRLAFAQITTAVAVSVLSNQQAGDVAGSLFTCVVTGAGSLVFTGALTSIYTGAVTTYVAGAAAPSTDDGYTMIDATIPVSFTASGLLADGVLFKRTNGTAAFWWAAKDMGGAAKLRISVPCTATGRAAIALANGDTYQAFTMPTILGVRFAFAQGALVNNVQFVNFVWSGVIERAPNNVEHVNCFEAGTIYSGTIFANSAFRGTVTFWPGGPSPTNHYFGLIRSGGALIISAGPLTQWNGRLVLQNGTIHPNGGTSLQFTTDLAMYDLAVGSALVADYWALVFFQNGAICGNGNAGNTVVWANKWSQITFMVASLSVAGTFTGGTPYSVGVTALSAAAVDLGTGNQLATKGNGIYPTT
jgi:hypothetical protein